MPKSRKPAKKSRKISKSRKATKSRKTTKSKIVKAVIKKSTTANKKLTAIFTYPNGRTKTTHFGQKGYSDYTIHKDDERKKRYINRHKKRESWGCSKFTTAGFLSRWILWNKKTLRSSVNDVNKKCKNVKFILK